MPTYEYQCGVCGYQLEAFQKMSDAPLRECPKCHGQTLNKLVSAAGFQLKGSGWYATDYRDKSKAKESKTEDKASSGSDTKTETKETKTDDKGKDKPKDTSSNSSSSAD